jgi:hypothetical protein
MRILRCKRCGVSNVMAGWRHRLRRLAQAGLWLIALAVMAPAIAHAQIVGQRGFIEGAATAVPEDAPNDRTNGIADLLAREEVFVKPADWIQFAAGVDFRANSHDQVGERWTLDFWDRGVRRPRFAVRRLTATLTHGPFTVDLGKQFVRWGTTDIVNPTDRFAPRDFVNGLDAEFLGITAARAVAAARGHSVDVVWTPRLTPSRIPLLTDRWSAVPEALALPLVAAPPSLPSGSQIGGRWSHVGQGLEFSLSFFNGYNHLPDERPVPRLSQQPPFVPIAVDVFSVHPPIRTYGGDLTWPTRFATVKAETAYFTSRDGASDEYALYVLQLERQRGEWVWGGGYAGEAITRRASVMTFAPDRGASRAILAHVSRTIDVNRSLAFEAAVRQNGRGAYAKVEYSQAHGQHLRFTATAVGLGGHSDDFFGQYHRNSQMILAARYNF